jgi:hypothetical protein
MPHMFAKAAAKKARLAAKLPKTRRQRPKHKVIEPGLIQYNKNVEKLANPKEDMNDNHAGGRRTRRRSRAILFRVLRNPTRQTLNAVLRSQ